MFTGLRVDNLISRLTPFGLHGITCCSPETEYSNSIFFITQYVLFSATLICNNNTGVRLDNFDWIDEILRKSIDIIRLSWYVLGHNKVNDSHMKLSCILVEKHEWSVLSTRNLTYPYFLLRIKGPGSNTNSNKNVTYQLIFCWCHEFAQIKHWSVKVVG